MFIHTRVYLVTKFGSNLFLSPNLIEVVSEVIEGQLRNINFLPIAIVFYQCSYPEFDHCISTSIASSMAAGQVHYCQFSQISL